MATRERRLSEFNTGQPSDHAVELLCEDHNGTYVLPYLCERKVPLPPIVDAPTIDNRAALLTDLTPWCTVGNKRES